MGRMLADVATHQGKPHAYLLSMYIKYMLISLHNEYEDNYKGTECNDFPAVNCVLKQPQKMKQPRREARALKSQGVNIPRQARTIIPGDFRGKQNHLGCDSEPLEEALLAKQSRRKTETGRLL